MEKGGTVNTYFGQCIQTGVKNSRHTGVIHVHLHKLKALSWKDFK